MANDCRFKIAVIALPTGAIRLALAASVCLGFTALAAPSGPIILTPEEIHHTRNDIAGTVGNMLAILKPRTVDKLGVFDAGGDGLTTAHEVGIWRLRTGELVASATVPAGTKGELIDGFRYVKLPKPVDLKRSAYRIGARFVRGGAFPRGELAPGSVNFMVKREGDETNYEIAVPWRQLDTKLSAPPADKQLGFGIVVNDVDIERGFKTDRQSIGAFGHLAAAPSFGALELE